MWPDKETEIDYLNFGYMVDLVVDIATNREFVAFNYRIIWRLGQR